MTQHTDKQYEGELQILKEEILKMGGIVERMIKLALQAYQERNTDAANQVIGEDLDVDRFEIKIDDICIKLLALRQPAASDLRFITIGLRIATDLERMGDLAVNIAGHAKSLNMEPALQVTSDLKSMSEKSLQMVKEALDAFVSQDTQKAQSVCDKDDEVDEMKHQIQEELTKMMSLDSKTVTRAVRILQITGHLERIADHSTNIAEEVIFMVKGKDIRHGGVNG